MNTEESANVSQNFGHSLFNLNLYLGIMNSDLLKGRAKLLRQIILFWVKNFGYCYSINFFRLIRIIIKENLKLHFFVKLDQGDYLFSLMKLITNPAQSVFDCDVKFYSFIMLIFSQNRVLKNLRHINDQKYELIYIYEETAQIIKLIEDGQEIRLCPKGDIETVESDSILNELDIHHKLSIILTNGLICINEFDSINSFRMNLNKYSKYVLHTNFIFTFVNSVFLVEQIQYPNPLLNKEIDFYKETNLTEINLEPLIMITPLKNRDMSSMIYKPKGKNYTIYIERIGKDIISFSEKNFDLKNLIATITYNPKKGWILSQVDDPSKENETYVYLSPFKLNGKFFPYCIQLDVPLITINMGCAIVKIKKL